LSGARIRAPDSGAPPPAWADCQLSQFAQLTNRRTRARKGRRICQVVEFHHLAAHPGPQGGDVPSSNCLAGETVAPTPARGRLNLHICASCQVSRTHARLGETNMHNIKTNIVHIRRAHARLGGLVTWQVVKIYHLAHPRPPGRTACPGQGGKKLDLTRGKSCGILYLTIRSETKQTWARC